jgi:hypothetical protein
MPLPLPSFIQRMRVSFAQAMKERSAHTMIPQVGYLRVGPPPMPPEPKGSAALCMPPIGTEDGTVHVLIDQHGGLHTMRWHKEPREWAPMTPFQGNRVAFTAVYLAALGWRYGNSR